MYIKPKKSLGQNFLTDKNIQRKIVSACGFSLQDILLEIGAGRGDLTALIAKQVKKVFAVEIDTRLLGVLRENLSCLDNINILNCDILKFDISKFFANESRRIDVLGNIPYYITTPIIEHLIRHRHKLKNVFLTVQKELADRLAAQAGSKEYGSLSCFVQYYFSPKTIFSIKKNSFSPAPKVDSVFLKLVVRDRPLFALKDEAVFFNIIRAAFNQRRKTLRNSLKDKVPAGSLNSFFKDFNILPNIRPECLSLQDFANLANSIS
ncbi:MAG: ribosomal RNA small subunit methyltransferase A [Candidatus Omnitrophica bacterium]|nr:ribosomal RNA small subunit methyltransferase A [Candidatus Omnitrophota bacterium]